MSAPSLQKLHLTVTSCISDVQHLEAFLICPCIPGCCSFYSTKHKMALCLSLSRMTERRHNFFIKIIPRKILFFLLDNKHPKLPLNSVVMENASETKPESSAKWSIWDLFQSHWNQWDINIILNKHLRALPNAVRMLNVGLNKKLFSISYRDNIFWHTVMVPSQPYHL